MDDCYQQSINYSLGKTAPDLILKNGIVFDVKSGLFKKGDVVIKGHRIIGLFDDYSRCATKDTKIMDVSGKYILPGLIEPHIHVESSMLSLTSFSRVVIPNGTTTIINDPHEIANVLGKKGVRQIMNEGEDCNLRCYFTVPSCVPALGGEFESNGEILGVNEVKSLLTGRMAIGLGEVMNYPGVIYAFPDVLAKINETYKANGYKRTPLVIDGHCPDLSGKQLSAYINGGIMADHECANGEELEEKLCKGMHIMIRNGSSAKNMEDLLEYVIKRNIDTRRMMFCTDDINPYELLKKGHINRTLREAAAIAKDSNGRLTLLDIIRMTTLNVADYYNFDYLGKLSIQTRADIVVLEDLENFDVYATLINGKLRAFEGKIVNDNDEFIYHKYMLKTVKINDDIKADKFKVASDKAQKVRAIKINPGQLVTEEEQVTLACKSGILENDIDKDILKISIINRHSGNGNNTIGFIKGFGIKSGAMASTIGHDSHNLGIIGTNDEDMAFAVEQLKEMQGGIVVVENKKILAKLELRIAGLMSTEQPESVVSDKIKIYDAYKKLGGTLKDPVISMGFLQLPVIPNLKITDKALVKITPQGPEKVSLFID